MKKAAWIAVAAVAALLAGLGVYALTAETPSPAMELAFERQRARSAAAEAAPAASAPAITSGIENWSQRGEFISQAEAIERFDLKRRLQSYGSDYFKPNDQARVRVVEGDLHINGHLPVDWAQWSSVGLVITGNLHVTGPIFNASSDGGPFLLVQGQTQAQAIVGGGAELVFEGDARVDDIVLGHYNDGVLIFQKNLSTPAAVTLDHFFDVRGELDGIWFDPWENAATHTWNLILPPGPVLQAMQQDPWRGIEETLIPALLRGEKVLRPDLPPKAQFPKHGGH